jgi:hypothetical protein
VDSKAHIFFEGVVLDNGQRAIVTRNATEGIAPEDVVFDFGTGEICHPDTVNVIVGEAGIENLGRNTHDVNSFIVVAKLTVGDGDRRRADPEGAANTV